MPEAQAGSEATQRLAALASTVGTTLSADIFALTGGIEDPADFCATHLVKQNKRCPNAVLIVTTLGGSADVAYRIARHFQRVYKDGKFIIFVHTFCKSAGTLLTLGADEIAMSDDAQLGPLDVQVAAQDELGQYNSGLTPVQALSFLQEQTFQLFENHFLSIRARSGFQVMTKTAADIASKMAVGLFEPIYAQLDPLRLGENQRSMMIAYEYGTRLAHNNFSEQTLKKLIAQYPSHGFVIDREEASTLFRCVRSTTDDETRLMNEFLSSLSGAIKFDEAARIDYIGSGNPQEARHEQNDGHERADGAATVAADRLRQGAVRAVAAGVEEPVQPNS